MIFLPSGPAQITIAERAHREVEALTAISSSRVVKVLSDATDIFDNGDRIAIAWLEEELDGDDLSGFLGPLWNFADVERLMLHIGEGLAEFHALDIVHRDLSPGNVRRLSDGYFALMDPGFARHLARSALTGVFQPGTIGYRSPEHVPGGDPQPASDIYVLGILAFAALTGHLPVDASGSEEDYYRRLATYDPPSVAEYRPDTPESLRILVDRCLQRQSARRYLDAQELLDAMRDTI